MLLIVIDAGCDLPDRPTFPMVKSTAALSSENPVSGLEAESLEPPTALDQPAWETWDAYYSNNQHVGYSHVKASPNSVGTTGGVHYDLDYRVYQTNKTAKILQRMVLSSDETRDGRLLGFDGTMQTGLAVTHYSGAIDGSNLIVEIRDGSDVERSEIPWKFAYRGIFAIEQSLRASPMREKGQTRALRMLISGRYQLATAKLRCSGIAIVPMLSGTEQELIEINVEIEIDGAAPIYSAIWTDEEGNVVRTYSPALNMITYRTDQAQATGVKQDDLVPVWIGVGGTMDRPQETKRVAYRISPADSESTVGIKPGPGQFVRVTDDGAAQVLVSRQEEKPSGGFVADEPKPTIEDRRPNFFVDSRSELVTKFADAAVGKRKLSKLEIALELTETANRIVKLTPGLCGLAKASETALVAEGDCTRSAVLLAALLRAQNIPSRIAIGLRFEPESASPPAEQRMVAHVWTIAYIDDHWVHLDATVGKPAAADRLLLSTTNLSENDQNQAFAPLTEDVGQMEVQVLAAKY